MKKILPIILLLICSNAYAQTYTVERVIDGDTIVVTTPEGKSEKVRLIGIDSPESRVNNKTKGDADRSGQDIETITKMEQEVANSLNGFLPKGREVRLEYDVLERDESGRKLVYVWRIKKYDMDFLSVVRLKSDPLRRHWKSDKDFGWYLYLVNGEIIRAGYASPMTIPPNVKYADLFKELYKEARENKRGLWVDKMVRSKKENSNLPKNCESDGDCTFCCSCRPIKQLKAQFGNEPYACCRNIPPGPCRCINNRCQIEYEQMLLDTAY